MTNQSKERKRRKEDITFDDIGLLMSQPYENVFVSQSVTFKRSQGKSTLLSPWIVLPFLATASFSKWIDYESSAQS